MNVVLMLQGGEVVKMRATNTSVLIADDSRELTAALAVWFRARGIVAHTVSSGDVALSRVAAVKPTLALIDLCMPGVSGWEVARRIRALQLETQPFLVAISGLSDPVLRTRALTAGFDRYFVKPLDLALLSELL